MILNVSGKTDIIAFYSKWFFNRLEEGYVDVRNPFYPKLISRINFSDVDLILFCTKNPISLKENIDKIKIPFILHVTITPYNKEIEPNVIDKTLIIDAVKQISKKIGASNITVRYDPIFLSPKYNLSYHIKAFDKLCKLLNGYIDTIIISFLDEYKNVYNNKDILKYRAFTQEDYKVIGTNFSKIAKENNIKVQTCFEEENLTQYGFNKGECLSHELAYKLTNKTYKNWTARKEKKCNCVQMVDIGFYNTCNHLCKYCYANYDEKKVKENIKNHNPNSSLLIGDINPDDTIKPRKN